MNAFPTTYIGGYGVMVPVEHLLNTFIGAETSKSFVNDQLSK